MIKNTPLTSAAQVFQEALSLHRAGRLPEALALYQRLLDLDARHFAALHLSGKIKLQLGQPAEAVNLIHNALAIQPNAHMYCDLGAALQAAGRLKEAEEAYRSALGLAPNHADAHNSLGAVLYALGRIQDAVGHYRQAIALDANFAEAMVNLGIALVPSGAANEAIRCFRNALALKPDFAEGYNGFGIALQEQGQLEEAIGCYRRALALKPALLETYNNLGLALQEQGKLDEAMDCFRKALSLAPDYDLAQSNLLLAMSFDGRVAPEQYLDEARRYSERLAVRARPYTYARARLESAPLKVGLVSGDFREHPVGYFLENLVRNVDPARVQWVAYSTYPVEDGLTRRLKQHVAAWRPIGGLSDEDAARMIHEDGIHILVDLAGQLAHNRFPIFAFKPAPVQVNWLGYWATSGMPAMDFLLADPISIPEPNRAAISEKVWYLPDTRLCFTPPEGGATLDVKPLPALRSGHVTLGCFQRLFKINDSVLEWWGEIFRLLPGARLRLQNKQLNCRATREWLLGRMVKSGIPAERIITVSPAARENYLAAYGEVDFLLDTFPYTGGTTTCEALWMGVPTLTLAGASMIARQGASMMASLGLDDWIARDGESYVERAVAHATDIAGLSRLRAGLRDKALASPLFDGPGFARHFEEALYGMWRNSPGPD